MAFKPSDAVEALDYDFRDSGVEFVGTIPEPSQDDLDALFADMRKIGTEGALGSLASVQDGDNPVKALAALDENALTDITGALVAAVAKLCKGTPTEDEINALPVRHRQVFISHLLDQITNPQLRQPASRPAVVRTNGAALAG